MEEGNIGLRVGGQFNIYYTNYVDMGEFPEADEDSERANEVLEAFV